MVVAIDGPAGSGKSTVAREVARRLDYGYLDSGAMYRTLALSLVERPTEPAQRARELRVELGERVLLDGRDVTEAIRSPDVGALASRIATERAVRVALAARQRSILAEGDWVAEGRDIGTVIAPNAELKLFLTASPEARAMRRAADLGLADWRVVLRDQSLRDAQDEQRAHSPLRPAIDAIELDTTDRSVEDVVAQVVGLVREARRSSKR